MGYEQIKKALSLLNKDYAIKYGDPKISIANTVFHEMAKCKLIYLIKKEYPKKKILCEVVFKNGKRADVLVLDDMRVYEVLHSETTKECLSKIESYPDELDIVMVRSEEVLENDYEF